MKTLAELCQFLKIKSSSVVQEMSIEHLSIDSKNLNSQTIFVALQGEQSHGLDYVKQAEKLQSKVVLIDVSDTSLVPKTVLQVLAVENLVEKLPALAQWFYNDPSQQLKIVGITGTNGKTSVSHYVGELLNKTVKTAILGTLGNGLVGQLTPSLNTTLEPLALNRLLASFVVQSVEVVVMEVSSHAIALKRIEGLTFDVLALTQVSRDHLDFHGSEEAYVACKEALFITYKANSWVLNSVDSLGQKLASMVGYEPSQKITYGLLDEDNIVANNIDLTLNGLDYKVSYGEQSQLISSSLFGWFNIENSLCALAICMALDLKTKPSFVDLCLGLTDIKPVAGRMEQVQNLPKVILDYAHTSDALKMVLESVKKHIDLEQNKLWVIFGCGGDRDKGKRPLMAKVAETYADKIILTDDNPRFESPEQIIVDVMKGFSKACLTASPAKLYTLNDRQEAITFALQQANKNDVIVVAGKGHETYQDIKGIKHPMSDLDLIQNAVKRANK